MDKLLHDAIAKMEAETAKNGGPETDVEATDDSKQLRNQFNYSDRGCQTVHPQRKTRGCYTEPPKTTIRCGKQPQDSIQSLLALFIAIAGSCSQWDIYDNYCKDIEAQKAQEQQNKRKNVGAKKTKSQQTEAAQTAASNTQSKSKDDVVSLRAAKVVERMTVQNIFDEVIMDLKYWEDHSDEFRFLSEILDVFLLLHYRPNEASLLPLWTFFSNNSNGKQVTALCPNTKHSDVFAVGYGSYESLKQTAGMICVYSLKNPSVPEKTMFTESGVLTITFHPDFPNLLAGGCYDGSVRVLDTKGNVLRNNKL